MILRIDESIDQPIRQLIDSMGDSPIGWAILAFYLFYHLAPPRGFTILPFCGHPGFTVLQFLHFRRPTGFTVLLFLPLRRPCRFYRSAVLSF